VFENAGYSLRGFSGGVELGLDREQYLEITLLSLDGKQIPVAARRFTPGNHRLSWENQSLGAGVHLIDVRGSGGRKTAKVVMP
jgi:hypothetical protein